MGEWIFRFLAAVGILAVEIILCVAVIEMKDRIVNKQDTPADGPEQGAKQRYVIFVRGKHYIADAPDLDDAMEIYRVDEYGMWKTERGIKGPWKLMEERHD